ncbi:hypothetical protein [Enterococcus sp. HY326]|uniref:hypothetical protein n=1 Tax=Enterococcus sp. HY326 TaxID=2971265 RepID=UPI00223F77E9|nr:hypothetical protein [Enterococcus sp. HY326]
MKNYYGVTAAINLVAAIIIMILPGNLTKIAGVLFLLNAITNGFFFVKKTKASK